MKEDKKIIAERIKKIRTDNNLTQEEFAKRLGLNNKSSIANYESGYSLPSDEIKFESHFKFFSDDDIQTLISSYKNEDMPYIKYDNLTSNDKDILNDMISNFVSIKDGKQISYPMEYYKKQLSDQNNWTTVLGIYLLFIKYTHDLFEKIDETFSDDNSEEKELKKQLYDTQKMHYAIPVYSQISAKQPNWSKENIIGHITDKNTVKDYEKNIDEYYALQVTDDSMLPLLSKGDLVIVHSQDDVESGQTAVVLINGEEATVKKVIKTNEGIELHAMNPYYPIKKFTFEDMKNIPVKIIGRVKEAKIKGAFE